MNFALLMVDALTNDDLIQEALANVGLQTWSARLHGQWASHRSRRMADNGYLETTPPSTNQPAPVMERRHSSPSGSHGN